jgi:parvulin-like peptidyl-prolyl isomerase
MTRFVLRMFLLGTICHLLLTTGKTWAQEPSAATEEVAASVNGEPIYAAEVIRLLNKVTRGREVNPAALPLLKAQILEQIVNRRLVLAYARRTNSAPTPQEVDSELDKLKATLSARQRSLADYLKSQAITEADLSRQIVWNLVWEKQLAENITEARLESYFQSHRRDFDGSEVAVSHILLKPQKGASARDWEELIKRAAAIRQEIVSGKISFAQAAEKYSAGPSAKDGGQLGFIPRHGVMDEAFSRAAFALEVGQVSKPVRTPFGINLIRCNSIKPGTKKLNDVRKQLEEALARELLEKLARAQLQFTPVEYTGKMPYLKPGTRELVAP